MAKKEKKLPKPIPLILVCYRKKNDVFHFGTIDTESKALKKKLEKTYDTVVEMTIPKYAEMQQSSKFKMK